MPQDKPTPVARIGKLCLRERVKAQGHGSRPVELKSRSESMRTTGVILFTMFFFLAAFYTDGYGEFIQYKYIFIW